MIKLFRHLFVRQDEMQEVVAGSADVDFGVTSTKLLAREKNVMSREESVLLAFRASPRQCHHHLSQKVKELSSLIAGNEDFSQKLRDQQSIVVSFKIFLVLNKRF